MTTGLSHRVNYDAIAHRFDAEPYFTGILSVRHNHLIVCSVMDGLPAVRAGSYFPIESPRPRSRWR
jgi:hypothetical protein